MAGYLPENIIDEVRSVAGIVEVVGEYVNLKKAGNVYRGLCPFHAEKTPSFTVNPERRIFHCFGCGVGGNVFRFLMLHKGLSFPESVRELAERFGVDIPRTALEGQPRDRQGKRAIYDAVDLARRFFEEQLWSAAGSEARQYLIDRGIGPELIKEYHLGWAPPGWDNLAGFLQGHKVPFEVIEKAGLVKSRVQGRGFYDTFRDRVICPIFDLDGKTVAFGGRLLREEEKQPKYLNSPETPIYTKGNLLYGLHAAKKVLRDKKTVLVVEGYFDYLSLAAQGVRHAAATLGTALTARHLRLLKGYVQRVILVFDADEAGRRAAARALPLFMSADLQAGVLRLPDGHDPDTYIREFGAAALETACEEAEDLLDFYLDNTLSRYPDNLSGRSRAFQEIVGAFSEVEGRFRLEMLQKVLAERLGVSEEAVRLAQRPRSNNTTTQDGENKRRLPDLEIGLIHLLVLHPSIAPKVFGAIGVDHFQDHRARNIYGAMHRQFLHWQRIEIEKLVEDLEPDDINLAVGLASDDIGLDPEDLAGVTDDYLEKFAQRKQRMETRALSQKIKRAQAMGDFAGLENLLREKNRLLQSMKPEMS